MHIDDLPFIDEHCADVAASAADTWAELVASVDSSFLRPTARRFARVVGCEQTGPSGPRPLAAGSTIAGFRVETAVPGSALVLAGRHRFAAYGLAFHLEARGPRWTRLYAETRASFPGLRGGVYRLLVISGGGHAVAVRRLLATVKRRVERARDLTRASDAADRTVESQSVAVAEEEEFAAIEVRGISPAGATDTAAARRLREALARTGVIVLRFAHGLTDPEARSIASMIGPIKDPVGPTRDGVELRYADDRQVMDSGFVLTDELRDQLGGVSFGGDATRPGLFEAFHTDDTFTRRPAAASVLHARALPSTPGGPTRFLDMRAAYESLASTRRAELVGRRAVYAYDNGGAFPPRPPSTGPASALAPVSHPIVRRHPVTGDPVLYLDLDRATHVEGMPVDEGRALLQALQDHAEAEAPRWSHHWEPHDVLVWDNARVQHAATGDFPVGEPRRFWRYLVEGPVPVGTDLGIAREGSRRSG